MVLFIKIFLIVMSMVVINANLMHVYLDKKTKPKKCDIYDQIGVLFLFMFFGVFTLPFIEQVKRLRKRLYLKKMLNRLKYEPRFLVYSSEPDLTYNDIEKEIFIIERYLKLQRIKKKV